MPYGDSIPEKFGTTTTAARKVADKLINKSAKTESQRESILTIF
jgi:hypothetical protein